MFNTLKFHSSLGLSGNSLSLSLLDTAMRGFSMGRFTPVPDVIVPNAILGLFSLSIRRFTDQSLATDYALKAVFRSHIMVGDARGRSITSLPGNQNLRGSPNASDDDRLESRQANLRIR